VGKQEAGEELGLAFPLAEGVTKKFPRNSLLCNYYTRFSSRRWWGCL
jgi:hypothetical protein